MLFPAPPPPLSAPRVVVTGAGMVTSLGLDWAANADGFRLGRTGFRPVSLFDVTRQRVQTAAEVDLPATLPRTRLGGRQAARLDRAARMLLVAASEAWDQSGWDWGARAAVVLGTTSGGMTLGQEFYQAAIASDPKLRGQATRSVHYQAQRQGIDLVEAFDLHGPVTIIANACASGANAVGHGWTLLRQGQAERVLVGGYDALSQLVFAGFDSLQALSPTVCRPFDAGRDGLALGEGAAVFALETLPSAERSGRRILGEITGYGAATDVHHLTQPQPDGVAALASMRAACAAAGLEPGEVGYVNAHGTGTPLNDSAEAAAIRAWAGSRCGSLPVSSTKASVGHLLGAAGAVEVGVCLMALEGQWLPPTRTHRAPDPAVTFPIVTEPTGARFNHALTNSFGFGGANATVILRRCG